MSRKKFFLTGLASGYLLIGMNFLFTFFSVPLVLRYLSQAEFGVWALVAQFAGYLLLIDLGVSASVSRLLADHKDRKDSPEYSQVFFASFLVSGIQGLVLLGLGVLAAWFAPMLANIPADLRPVFSRLLLGYVAVTAVCLAFRSLASPLWSHQRLDICNLGNTAGLFLNLIGLWAGMHAGLGLYGLLVGTVVGALPGLVIPFLACRHYGYYPRWPGGWHFQRAHFRELFLFSRDIFIFQCGSQLASATQMILVSRFLSVESAALWAIGTKAFTLGQQLGHRILDASAGALTEMFVRSERARFLARFQDVVQITAWLCAVMGLAMVFLNTPFVFWWTGGKILWPSPDNTWLAFLLFSTGIARCHLGLGGITKEMSTFRWLQIAEALVMIGLGIFFIPRLGIAGILAASLLANTGVSLVASTMLNSRRLAVPLAHSLSWLWPALGFLALGCGAAWIWGASAWGQMHAWGAWAARLFFLVLLAAVSFRFCLRPGIRQELLRLVGRRTRSPAP